MNDEHQKGPRRIPSRRALLTAGAAIGGSALAGSTISLSRWRREQEDSSARTAPPSPTATASPWAPRDERFLATLRQSTETLPITKEYRGAFPSLKIRDVLPLNGLDEAGAPWTVKSLVVV